MATATVPTTSATLEPEAAPPAPPRRPRVLLVGSALAAAASAMAILVMVAAYLALRSGLLGEGQDALPEGVEIPLTPGTMNLGTLVMSVITAAWIVYSLRNDDRIHAWLALGLTLLFGVAFITQTSFLYTEMGYVIADSPQAVFVYAATGAHIAMAVGGLIFLGVMGFQALGGQLTGRDADGMSAATLYWYATVAVYAVIWYAIYVTK